MSATVDTGAVASELEECPDCLRGSLNWLLTQAHRGLASRLAGAFEPLGITPRGHSVLAAAMTGSHTQKQLAEVVGVDKTTMVVTLDELEAAGLARRVSAPGDRRARVVEVTEAGGRKVADANRVAMRVEGDVLSSLEGTGGESLLSGLCELVRNGFSEPGACKPARPREPRRRAAGRLPAQA